jgi:hypothetical protein
LLFPGIFRKPVVAQFDQREGSSDGGTLLLKAADRYYGLVAGLASCLRRIPLQGRQVPLRRRVIIKGEVFRASDKEPEDNPRFVITTAKVVVGNVAEHSSPRSNAPRASQTTLTKEWLSLKRKPFNVEASLVRSAAN